MLAALLALVAPIQEFQAGRHELGRRLRETDAAWMRATGGEAKRAAVSEVSASVMAFFGGRTSEASAALDRARAALGGPPVSVADAVDLRFVPLAIEPDGTAELQLTWAYDPGVDGPVEVGVAGEATMVMPGRAWSRSVRAAEVGIDGTIAVSVGGHERRVWLGVFKNLQARVTKVSESRNPTAAGIGRFITTILGAGFEGSPRAVLSLETAEALDKGAGLEGREVVYALHEGTPLRASFPESPIDPPTLVVALHGAGGSENLFFEGYGAGLGPRLAAERGWTFVAPRATPSGAQRAVDWYKSVTGKTPARVFVIGHSMGGGIALRTGTLEPKPTALGLFAPAAAGFGPGLERTPVFLAVGAQEIPGLKQGADRLAALLPGRPHEYKVVDPCEHLMIVVEALPECFRWFDGLGTATGGR